MKRVLTWIKPTWSGLHIWNYLWAFKPFLDLAKWKKAYIFVADYHSLTSVHDGEPLRQNKRNMLIEYFSLIPEDSEVVVFEQSKIKRINDITWILSSLTPLSLMQRAHSYKDAIAKELPINMATFNYPLLMTSDIITYDTDIVPVWKDQIQHLEFARDIAGFFNNNYGTEIFKLPEAHVDTNVQTIPWTDGRKMSKSYNNFIPLFASKKELKKIVMSIVTDDTPLEKPKNPDTCNVFALIKFFASEEKAEEIRNKYLAWNYGYGHAKLELLDILLDYTAPFRERKEFLENNFNVIEEKLAKWNAEANEMADKKYSELMKIIWLND